MKYTYIFAFMNLYKAIGGFAENAKNLLSPLKVQTWMCQAILKKKCHSVKSKSTYPPWQTVQYLDICSWTWYSSFWNVFFEKVVCLKIFRQQQAEKLIFQIKILGDT